MVNQAKELISRFMDDDLELSKSHLNMEDKANQATWMRYHLVQTVLTQPQDQPLFLVDVTESVARAIEQDSLKKAETHANENQKPALNLLTVKMKKWWTQCQHIGVAAAVAVAILTGVQFLDQDNEDDYVIMNTVPVGIKTEAVGGVPKTDSEVLMNESQHNKIRLLTQEYELQKRLNPR